MAAAVKTVREPQQCARPGCQARFTPAHKNHVYCSSTCKKRAFSYRHVLNSGGRR